MLMSSGFEVRPEADSENMANFETATLVMSAFVQYLLSDPRLISHTRRCQRDLVGPFALDQAFAAKGVPNIFIFQAGGVAGGNGRIAQMKMIAMSVRKLGDGGVAFGRGIGGTGDLRNRLQQGEGAQLQGIELGRIGFGRDRASLRSGRSGSR